MTADRQNINIFSGVNGMVVDDSKMTCKMIAKFLSANNNTIHQAYSAKEAKKLLISHKGKSIDCIFVDYSMPGEDGISLLHWIKEFDPEVTVAIITSKDDKFFIKTCMRAGAFDFIPKPINPAELIEVYLNGIRATRKRRKLAESKLAAEQFGSMQSRVMNLEKISNDLTTDIAWIPKHMAGGDFIGVVPIDKGKYAMLLADISGHDYQAAYISSFFHGLATGMLAVKKSIPELLNFFNDYLDKDLNNPPKYLNETAPPPMISIAVSCLMIDTVEQSISNYSNGIPGSFYIDKQGYGEIITPGSCPLGLYPDIDTEYKKISTKNEGYYLMGSDGIFDHAKQNDINIISLSARLLWEKDLRKRAQIIDECFDDVLLVRLNLHDKSLDSRDSFVPVYIRTVKQTESEFQFIYKSLLFALNTFIKEQNEAEIKSLIKQALQHSQIEENRTVLSFSYNEVQAELLCTLNQENALKWDKKYSFYK